MILEWLWVIAGIVFALSLVWNYYQLRQHPFYDTDEVTIECDSGLMIVVSVEESKREEFVVDSGE